MKRTLMWMASATALSATVACGDAPRAADSDPVLGEFTSPWIARATDGTVVSVSPRPGPPSIGRLLLEISVSSESAGGPVSVDLVSPTMPAHGVIRRAVMGGVAELEIPMEGSWAIYVNLDEVGANSAEFMFEVAGESGMMHSAGGTASSSDHR